MQVGNSCMEVVVGAVLVHSPCGNLVLVNDGRLERQRTRKECGQCGCWTNQFQNIWAKVSGLPKEESMFQNTKQPAVEWDAMQLLATHKSSYLIKHVSGEFLLTLYLLS